MIGTLTINIYGFLLRFFLTAVIGYGGDNCDKRDYADDLDEFDDDSSDCDSDLDLCDLDLDYDFDLLVLDLELLVLD